MKKQMSVLPKYLLIAGFSLVLLSACGKSLENPETVINKAKQAVVDVSSGNVEISAKASGKNATDDLLFDGKVGLLFDKKDATTQKMNLTLAMKGNMKTGDQKLDGDLDLNFVNLGKEYFVKLNKLTSSDPSLASVKPFIDLYSGKWLHIAEDFIPKNIRDLQSQTEASKLKKKQLEDLFVQTKLFDVTKEYGMEKLDGKNVYHYGLSMNVQGFKDYMTKAAIIDGREMTAQEVDDSVKLLSYVKDADIYIDSESYYVLQSTFHFSGAALNQGANLDVEITVKGSQYGDSVKIEAPEGAEDFNPLNLMMGLGGVPTAPTADGTTTAGDAVVAPADGTTPVVPEVPKKDTTSTPQTPVVK